MHLFWFILHIMKEVLKQIKLTVFIHAKAMAVCLRRMRVLLLSHLCSDHVEASRLNVSHLVCVYGLLPLS